MELIDRVRKLAAENWQTTVQIRRHMHQYPELSFQEHKTAQYIASVLQEHRIDFQAEVAETGLLATIKGKNPESKTIALRSDHDALPITETNDVPYKSKNEGIMHACGHDVHTSSMLGAILILNQLKGEFEGTVKCLFQPGEEKVPGGATKMIAAGALKNPAPSSIFAQHVYPELEVGQVGFCGGKYMASADEIYVTVYGKGGHAALPHRLADPVLIASHLVVALQQVVSRNIKPDIPAVLSFGKFIANGATNIIPGEVKLEGTFRTYNEEWRDKAHGIMKHLAETLAESMGGSCDFQVHRGYPYLYNDPSLTEKAKQSAISYLGKEHVIDLDTRMTSEDFAFYSHELPACFWRLGIANQAQGINSGLHTPTFNVDEKALEVGAGLMAWIALNDLGAVSR